MVSQSALRNLLGEHNLRQVSPPHILAVYLYLIVIVDFTILRAMVKFLIVHSHLHNCLFRPQEEWFIIWHKIGYVIINSYLISCIKVMLMLVQKKNILTVHNFSSEIKSSYKISFSTV